MKNNLIFLLNLLILIIITGCTESGIVIKGTVINGLNGDPVEKVKVTFKESRISTATDKEGYFSLTIPLSEIEGIDTKIIDSVQYFVLDSEDPVPFLVAQKKGFQDLE